MSGDGALSGCLGLRGHVMAERKEANERAAEPVVDNGKVRKNKAGTAKRVPVLGYR